jgi:hypothetical protein
MKETKGNTVGSVATFESANIVLPVLVAGIVTFKECALLKKGELSGSLADDTDLVSVLHVAADTRKVLDDFDTVRFKLLCRPNAAQLQDLRSVEGTARDNDFAASMNSSSNTAILCPGTRISTVQASTEEIINASRLGLSVGGIEVDLGNEGVESNVKLVHLRAILVGCSSDLEHKVARRATYVISVHGQRDLVDKLVVVARFARVVDVESQDLNLGVSIISNICITLSLVTSARPVTVCKRPPIKPLPIAVAAAVTSDKTFKSSAMRRTGVTRVSNQPP